MVQKVVITAVLGALVGCGQGGGGRSVRDEAMARIELARDQACACKDPACGEQARVELKTWIKANTPRLQKLGVPPKAYSDRYNAVSLAAEACLEKLKAAATSDRRPAPAVVAPGSPPPAPPPPTAPTPP